MAVVLIGGGARSGKSSHALRLARDAGTRLAFVATAEANDDEMRTRIAKHRGDRSRDFKTLEEPINLADVLNRTAGRFDAMIVDCLTLWLTNLMLHGENDIELETRSMLAAAKSNGARILLVTNEVGCGIVPENPLARRFRDLAGWMNQTAAAAADEVYWMIFGCPLKVK
jgi:adenosylcobinamide kinase/adenosylcobinamide-phosphate guanylyltransferase